MSFTICHFNDAYLPKLAPFWQSIVEAKYPDALITCGGDVFNPSLMSTVTRGKHVPPLLNAMGASPLLLFSFLLFFFFFPSQALQ